MKKYLYTLIIALIGSSTYIYFNPLKEKPFVIVITSYNNEKWAKSNITSALKQKYKNFRIIYINDASKDATGNVVETTVKNSPHHPSFRRISFNEEFLQGIPEVTERFAALMSSEPCFFTLIDNVYRAGALANLYRAIHSCQDEAIIITLDGDDWLRDDQVLRHLNRVYSRKNTWLTHGKLIEHPGGSSQWCEPIPSAIIKQNAFREFKCPSHLRTFYAWLFKKIELNDLLYEGQFFPMTWDMAIMYPMIEMAGERHTFIPRINYVYNIENPINDNKVDADLQNILDRYIRQSPRYKKL